VILWKFYFYNNFYFTRTLSFVVDHVQYQCTIGDHHWYSLKALLEWADNLGQWYDLEHGLKCSDFQAETRPHENSLLHFHLEDQEATHIPKQAECFQLSAQF
jgi:hypothetical protein